MPRSLRPTQRRTSRVVERGRRYEPGRLPTLLLLEFIYRSLMHSLSSTYDTYMRVSVASATCVVILLLIANGTFDWPTTLLQVERISPAVLKRVICVSYVCTVQEIITRRVKATIQETPPHAKPLYLRRTKKDLQRPFAMSQARVFYRLLLLALTVLLASRFPPALLLSRCLLRSLPCCLEAQQPPAGMASGKLRTKAVLTERRIPRCRNGT